MVSSDHVEDPSTPQGYSFNPDPQWQAYAASYDRMIGRIALKYCSADDSLRDDVQQEARIAIATLRAEDVDGFEPYLRGEITEEVWQKALRRYVHNVIRNSILSYLDSYPKGNWYIGRTRHVRDKQTGVSRKVYLPPRFSSLDTLVDDHGMQVDENSEISWPDPSDDGLLPQNAVAKTQWLQRWGVQTRSDAPVIETLDD